MNECIELAGFAAIMLAGQFSPGPDMLLLTRTSLQYGAKSGCLTACGISAGLVIHSTIALSGGAFLFSQQSPWLWFCKLLASLYLLYLAIDILRSPAVSAHAAPKPDAGGFFLRGFLCNLFNPKVALILASMSAPFLKPEADSMRPWLLGGIIVIQGAVLWSLWAYVLQSEKIRSCYERNRNLIGIVFAIFLVALALMIWR